MRLTESCFSEQAQDSKPNEAKAECSMKTAGEIEAAVCEGVARFEQDHMGRGPRNIRAYLIGDLVVVRLKGVLTVAEQQLASSLPVEKGRDLLKQVRIHLIETARPIIEQMIEAVTGVPVKSLHHDISTVTGEEVVLFTLAKSPVFRDGSRKPSLPMVLSRADNSPSPVLSQ